MVLMKKILLAGSVALLVLVLAEAGYYFYLRKTLKPKLSQPQKQEISFASPSPFEPLTPQVLTTTQGESLTSVYAEVKNTPSDGRTLIIADKNDQRYVVRLNPRTIFLTRIIMKNTEGKEIPADQLEAQPFDLKLGTVYLFEWLNQGKEPWELIRVTRSSKK